MGSSGRPAKARDRPGVCPAGDRIVNRRAASGTAVTVRARRTCAKLPAGAATRFEAEY